MEYILAIHVYFRHTMSILDIRVDKQQYKLLYESHQTDPLCLRRIPSNGNPSSLVVVFRLRCQQFYLNESIKEKKNTIK